ncbi:MAG TPA: hypothetical protein ENH33_00615 [Actinobacteria bacterium]|nr:hypothetical protein [Actinomycetota bacterium]
MRLTRLEIQNFMAITSFECDFGEGAVIEFTGKNGTGKTAHLKAIQALFAGGRAIPDIPIKHGAKKAVIIGETEALVCTRIFTAKGTTLTVRPNEAGSEKIRSPQAVLDELIGQFLDPLEFDRMEKSKRDLTLAELAKLDFSKLDEQRSGWEKERRDAGRDLKKARARIEALPEPEPEEDGDTDTVADLLVEIDRREQLNEDHGSKRSLLKDKRDRAGDLADGGIKSLEEIAQRMQDDADAAKDSAEAAAVELETLREAGVVLAAEVAAMIDLDVAEVRAKLSQAGERATAAARQEERQRLVEEANQLDKTYQILTAKMDGVDSVKARSLEKATYPIDGLKLQDGETYLDGVPWEQCNASRRIIASTSIGFAIHPQLKIVCVENASLLDETMMQEMRETAEKAGGQAFIEIVGKGDKVSVKIRSAEDES